MKLTNFFPTIMGLESISPEALHQKIQEHPVTVFDVNSEQSWMEHHVPGAQSLNPNSFNEGQLPPNKSSLLVFYCSNPMCRKAPNAAKKAKKMGFENIKVMSAGINGWLSANLPVENERS
ncbi:MAG: rhodanese-like domain-containing protein [Balneolaceae bacterium]|nr:rhodanese-like domain-containing protein [Balneolaceae bacterium]